MSKIPSLTESTLVDELLSKSAKGVPFLLLGQFVTKLSTFILNQILIAYISPKSFGMNYFLEFLMGSSLFFSREAIRLSAQRIKDPDHTDQITTEKKKEETISKYNHHKIFEGTRFATLQSIINLAYIPVMIGLPMTTLLFSWQYPHISDVFRHMHHFHMAIFCSWLAVIVELLSEPFYVLAQFNLDYQKRTQFETLALIVSCIVNFGVVYWFVEQDVDGIPILAFALGKLCHSVILLLAYYRDFINYKDSHAKLNQLNLLPTKIYKSETNYYYFDPDAKSHFYRAFFNISLKHLLTEGDKLMINSICSIEEIGIYSLISNYGSMLARLVFSPLEEGLRNFLTRLLLSVKSSKNIQYSADILKKITSFYIYLSLIIVIFGPLNSGYLIQRLVGNNWSNQVSDTIPWYMMYLPLLAFNGILEAVHQSTASGSEVVSYTYFMIVFSVIFLGSSYVAIAKLHLSLLGLIMSNMLNMALRIVYCHGFIAKFFKKHGVNFSLVSWDSNMKSITFVAGIIWLIDMLLFGFTRNLFELFGNCVLALALVGFIVYKEKALIMAFAKRQLFD
ncbi:CYFA0S05e05182g1_1 [Cyberlindnera fabianii]|uniref:Man(5)GlcNAc(2)-PP-dolichol translocation protein RFT1 n=1 Tax=Cyberlindnera fabianii TaxID=36022 RepID=A0A061ATD6_CYBFA|nr:Oligosaccharide translocation protein RFT1 [Cyberlindnera fabianii]CDR40852.1 CYFA0S05e05182g1_1 [Cyberlindnera fabianii]